MCGLILYILIEIMKNLLFFISLIIFLSPTINIQIQLNSEETCLQYIVTEPDSLKVFYFHYNHNVDNVNMVLYHRNIKQMMRETGFGFQYQTMLQVQYKEAGNYTMCFQKKSQGIADVSFEIVDQQKMNLYVGKQQLAKVSKRISEFLMDIKRVGWTFKQVLEQHNSRKDKIQKQQSSYVILLLIKSLVMFLIVGIQIAVIKKIFK